MIMNEDDCHRIIIKVIYRIVIMKKCIKNESMLLLNMIKMEDHYDYRISL